MAKDTKPEQTIISDTGDVSYVETSKGKHEYLVNKAPRNLRGPANKHDWQGVLRHLIIKVSKEGLPQGNGANAEVGRWMFDWFGESDVYPSETEVKKQVRLIFDELEKVGISDN